jgi:hypothetical protein
MGNGWARDFAQVKCFKLNLGLLMLKRYQRSAFDNKPIARPPYKLTLPKKSLIPKMFRKLAISDITSFFVSAYSLSLSPMLKGLVIDDILGDACHKINLTSSDADEDRDLTTLVLSSIFFHA